MESRHPTPPSRQNFERYAAEQGVRDFEQNEFGNYLNWSTNQFWIYWQAASSVPSETVAMHQVLPLPPQPETITTSTSDITLNRETLEAAIRTACAAEGINADEYVAMLFSGSKAAPSATRTTYEAGSLDGLTLKEKPHDR